LQIVTIIKRLAQSALRLAAFSEFLTLEKVALRYNKIFQQNFASPKAIANLFCRNAPCRSVFQRQTGRISKSDGWTGFDRGASKFNALHLLWPNKFSRQKGACPAKTLIVSCCASDRLTGVCLVTNRKNTRTFIKMQRRERSKPIKMAIQITRQLRAVETIFHSIRRSEIRCWRDARDLSSFQVALKGPTNI
jgi:hypothetical protein